MKRTPRPINAASTRAQLLMFAIDSHGWTQAELARRLGASPVTVARWRAQSEEDYGDPKTCAHVMQPTAATVNDVLRLIIDDITDAPKTLTFIRDGRKYVSRYGTRWLVTEIAWRVESFADGEWAGMERSVPQDVATRLLEGVFGSAG